MRKRWLVGACAVVGVARAMQAETPEPTPVTITEDDVAERQAENRQETLERAIRRDIERAQNWSNDNDD